MSKTLIYREDLIGKIKGDHPIFYDGQDVADWQMRCILDAPSVDTLMKEDDLIYFRHLLFNRKIEIMKGTERGYISPGEEERIKRLWDLLSTEITRKAERSLREMVYPEKPDYLEQDPLRMKRDPDREINNSSECTIVEVPKDVGTPYIIVGSTGLHMTKEYADVNMKLDSLNDLVKETYHGE